MSGRQPDPEFWAAKTVTVTGGAGFLGSFVVAELGELSVEPRVIAHAEHDLRDATAAREALSGSDVVIHLAARVGGIGYNRRNPAPLLHDNVMIAANIFEAAQAEGVAKLVTAGSVCAYPKHTPTPFREEAIWSGYPEESNAPYGIAKRVVGELARAYRSQHGLNTAVPVLANLYGPGDGFDLEDSHVVPALIRKFVEGREREDLSVPIWGTGSASREFLYVADAARALLLAAERLETSEPVNIGTGTETRIAELAETIRELTGFEGEISWDPSKPDGQPERRLDVSRATELLGFEPEVELRDGLRRTIEWFEARRSSDAG
jgi:GDP-L-fucose synthase